MYKYNKCNNLEQILRDIFQTDENVPYPIRK